MDDLCVSSAVASIDPLNFFIMRCFSDEYIRKCDYLSDNGSSVHLNC
jgi:hypothetical protein